MLPKTTLHKTCQQCHTAHETQPLFVFDDEWRTPDGPGAYHLACYISWALPLWKNWRALSTEYTEKTLQKQHQLLHKLLMKRRGADWENDPFTPYIPNGAGSIQNRSGEEYSKATIAALQDAWESERGFMTWCYSRPEIPQIFKSNVLVGSTFGDLVGMWEDYLLHIEGLDPKEVSALLKRADFTARSGNWYAPFIPAYNVYGDSDSTKRAYKDAWLGVHGFHTWYKTMEQETNIESKWTNKSKPMVSLTNEAVIHPNLGTTPLTEEAKAKKADILKRAQEIIDSESAPNMDIMDDDDPLMGDPHKWDGKKAETAPAVTKVPEPVSPVTPEPVPVIPAPSVIPESKLPTVKVGEESEMARKYLPLFFDQCIGSGEPLSVGDILTCPDFKQEEGLWLSTRNLDDKAFARRFALLILVKAFRKAANLG